jgi:hypothetical protein
MTFWGGGRSGYCRRNDTDSADGSAVATAVQNANAVLPQRHKEHREMQKIGPH